MSNQKPGAERPAYQRGWRDAQTDSRPREGSHDYLDGYAAGYEEKLGRLPSPRGGAEEWDLLPCPFCGQPAERYKKGPADWSIQCASTSECYGSSGWYGTEAEAVGVWNRRSTMTDQDAARLVAENRRLRSVLSRGGRDDEAHGLPSPRGGEEESAYVTQRDHSAWLILGKILRAKTGEHRDRWLGKAEDWLSRQHAAPHEFLRSGEPVRSLPEPSEKGEV